MNVKLKALTKVNGFWRDLGETVTLSEKEAKRLIELNAAVATGDAPEAPVDSDEVTAMRAELERLQEFERQQLAAAQAKAEQEEAERLALESAAAAKGKAKASIKDEADGQTIGK